MRRKKRFTIRLVALGFAVAAISAAPAQARLDEGLGVPKQSEPTFAVSPDDRAVNLMSPTQIAPTQVAPTQVAPTQVGGPDDRAFSRVSPVTPSQPTTITSDDGFEIGTLGMTGIALLLAAGLALTVVYQGRRGKLASV
jgi:hypothetical protein